MRTELDVPFSHKEEAKALGAKWDRTKKIWYVPSGVNPEPFAEWLPGVDRSDPSAPYIYLVLGKRECWKCHKETSVAAFGIPYRTDNDESIAIAHAPNEAGYIAIDTANANALAIVPALGCVPGEIRDYLHKRCGYKPVGARASKAPSLGNTCTSCDALQGSRYLFEEPSSPFALTAINKLPALEFIRVEVAGVFGVPVTRTDFDQALFTWARDHHAEFHKQLGGGFICRGKRHSQPTPPHHLSLVAGVVHDIEATNRAFLRIHRHMNACPFSHFVAESVARIDKPNVETRYLRAAARAGDDKRRAINLYARKHIVVYKGTRQFSVLPHRNIASPAHIRSPLAIQIRKSMHRRACARLHRHAIRSNNTIVKECQSQIR